jgi:hypothetical protein
MVFSSLAMEKPGVDYLFVVLWDLGVRIVSTGSSTPR